MPQDRIPRRRFLQTAAAGTAGGVSGLLAPWSHGDSVPGRKPNVLFVLTDQWRADATGYAGDPNALTPNVDRLAAESANFTNAVSGCPVCCPYRASLITGRYWLSHGVFLNDLCLSDDAVSYAEAFNGAGYQTGFIGKWHLDGHGRSNFVPQQRRQGFRYWAAAECTHDYNKSHYYRGNDPEMRFWEGYDAFAQTQDAEAFIRCNRDKPFSLVLSLGPPHNPYETAPAEYRRRFRPGELKIRPNVPRADEAAARRDLAGYYAHCAALDACVGRLRGLLDELRLAEDTILVFTSDHGDMLGSQGMIRKQKPWDESIRVPFLVHWPRGLGANEKSLIAPINSPDVMPTVLGLCGIDIPPTVEGTDRSPLLRGERTDGDEAALIACPSPFGEWARPRGGVEYRGVRTVRYTYARTLDGPWLLYDNEKDPYQMENLCGRASHAAIQSELEAKLRRRLAETNDDFRSGWDYIRRWGYRTDRWGTVPI